MLLQYQKFEKTAPLWMKWALFLPNEETWLEGYQKAINKKAQLTTYKLAW